MIIHALISLIPKGIQEVQSKLQGMIFVYHTHSFGFHKLKLKPGLFSQLTVYLGKRDFVDHLDHVDPVG